MEITLKVNLKKEIYVYFKQHKIHEQRILKR